MAETNREVRNVYVATRLSNKDVVLQDRGYNIIERIPHGDIDFDPLLIGGACVCQVREVENAHRTLPRHSGEEEAIAYWFCQGKNGDFATAKIHESTEDGKSVRQVVMYSVECAQRG